MCQRINSIHILLVIILVKVVHCQSLSPIGPSTCDSDPSIEGYSDIDVLRQDIIINSNITNKSQGGTYTLCPSIIFSFSNDFNTDTGNKDPLVIDANHTRIQCGSDALSTKGCVFQGGERHMLIIENPYNVTVQGVTMIESNEVSVIISSSVKSSSVIFTDCTWQNNVGSTTIAIIPPLGVNSNIPSQSPTFLNDDISITNATTEDILSPSKSLDFVIESSIFLDNDNNLATIANYDAFMTLTNTTFSRNIIGGSIIRVFGGSLQISRACFYHNSYGKDRFPGIIFLDQDSNLIQSENNYEINNTIQEKNDQLECKGIFEQISGTCGQSASQCNGSCSIFNASSCERTSISNIPSQTPSTQIFPTIMPTVSPFPTNSKFPTSFYSPTIKNTNDMKPETTKQYGDWNNLTVDIENASTNATGSSFIIQPGSILQSINPITINSTGIVIECGDRSDPTSRCIIEGGSSQFIITSSARSIQFIGLTFIDGDGVSIIAAGDVDSDVTIVDCEWFGKKGRSIIWIASNANQGLNTRSRSSRYFPIAPAIPDGPSMTVRLFNSLISDNELEYSTIMNIGGNLHVRDVIFQGNSNRGSISVLNGGSLSMMRSCFDSTKPNSTNIVFIQSGSNLVENENNFVRNIGANNATDICEGIFVESPGSDCVQNLTCEGVCMLMNGTSCLAGSLSNETSVPSLIPTLDPSVHPSITPSESPSTMPSTISTLDPSTSPSTAPSKMTLMPTITPAPVDRPTDIPQLAPSDSPSTMPSTMPTLDPSTSPSIAPSKLTLIPTIAGPTPAPVDRPSSVQQSAPSDSPSTMPSLTPTLTPSARPSRKQFRLPSASPSREKTQGPTHESQDEPSGMPQQSFSMSYSMSLVYDAEDFFHDDMFVENEFVER